MGPPSKRARTVEGPEDGPVVSPVDPVDAPSVTDVLQQQMHLMQAQMSSIQEVVMGMAASSQSVPLAPPEATSPPLPAAAGSAAAAIDAGVLGEESPQFPTNIQGFFPLCPLVVWSTQKLRNGFGPTSTSIWGC